MSASGSKPTSMSLLSELCCRVAAALGRCLPYHSFRGKFRLLHALCPRTGEVIARVGRNNVRLDLSDLIQRNMLLGTMYEEDRRRLRDLLLPGSIFLDVGANAGFFSLIASDLVGPCGRVFAFEPNPVMHARLARTLGANGVANVTLHQLALGSEPGVLPLYANSEPGNSTASMVWAGQSSQVQVAVDTLDRFIEREGLERIDLLKIDVDGLEPQILKGGLASLRAGKVKHLQVEFCEYWQRKNGGSCRDIEQLLLKAGFEDLNPDRPWKEEEITDRCFRWLGGAPGDQ